MPHPSLWESNYSCAGRSSCIALSRVRLALGLSNSAPSPCPLPRRGGGGEGWVRGRVLSFLARAGIPQSRSDRRIPPSPVAYSEKSYLWYPVSLHVVQAIEQPLRGRPGPPGVAAS